MRIGIDLGGTKTEVIALSEAGEQLFRHRLPTPRNDYQQTIETIATLVAMAEQTTGQTGTVGIGIPGSISPYTGVVKNANSTWLNGQPFDKDLSTRLQRDVRLANDANCLAVHYFSDEFQPLLNTEGPIKYVRPDVSHFELKKMRRGDYSPELFLDLHGLTQLQAKQELGALIAACRREHVFCACVMHGHGKHVLKQQTPLWLAQHPHVMAFHQAPKEYGGDAALLVLIEVEEWAPPELP